MLLGVLVLVVVMSVYSGLERDVKKRLLGFSPHVLLSHPNLGVPKTDLADWKEQANRAKTLPFVETALPHIADIAMLDVGSSPRPVYFHAIDTQDSVQVKTITEMLDNDDYPGSSAEMGLNDSIVVSSALINGLRANGLLIGVGDKVSLYSTKNFQEVMRVYKSTKEPLVREKFPEEWKEITDVLTDGWKQEGDKFTLPYGKLSDIYGMLDGMRNTEKIRQVESDRIAEIQVSMEEAMPNPEKTVYSISAETKAAILKNLEVLNTANQKEVDSSILENLRDIVLPKEATIIGVYRSSAQANTPDIFAPLHLAQGLAGLTDNVQGISLRLTDAKYAEETASYAAKAFGPEWTISTWGEQFQSFFSLINQQRAMMYFVLSFIALISAFSMMAVMFTVTIQKKREIGVMKALGATPSQIVCVFLYQGMILGVIGAVLGVGLGRLVIRFRGEIQSLFRTFGFDPFSSQFLGFNVLPAHNNPIEQAIFALMGFTLCSLAALVPAFVAARSDAAKSLRNL